MYEKKINKMKYKFKRLLFITLIKNEVVSFVFIVFFFLSLNIFIHC